MRHSTTANFRKDEIDFARLNQFITVILRVSDKLSIAKVSRV